MKSFFVPLGLFRPTLTLLVAFWLMGLSNGSAQGTVNFANSSSSLCLVCQGNSFVPAPVGSAFQVALYYAPDGTSAFDFDSFAIRLGAAANFAASGIFVGGTRTAPTAEPGGFGLFQVRGWQTAYGSTYEQVMASGMGMVGKSAVLRIDTGNPAVTPADVPVSLVAAGFTGLYISPLACPEPSVSAIGGILGTLCFLAFLLRRKRAGG